MLISCRTFWRQSLQRSYEVRWQNPECIKSSDRNVANRHTQSARATRPHSFLCESRRTTFRLESLNVVRRFFVLTQTKAQPIISYLCPFPRCPAMEVPMSANRLSKGLSPIQSEQPTDIMS